MQASRRLHRRLELIIAWRARLAAVGLVPLTPDGDPLPERKRADILDAHQDRVPVDGGEVDPGWLDFAVCSPDGASP